jgi:O-antigen ligase
VRALAALPWSGRVALVTVMAAPLPFGSSDAFWPVVWCGTLGVAALLVNPAELTGKAGWALTAVALFVLVALVAVYQHVAPPAGSEHPIWRELIAHGLPYSPRISIFRDFGWVDLAPLLAATLAFVLGLAACSSRGQLGAIFYLVSVAGLVYVVFALVSFGIAPSRVLWREKVQHVGNLTGTFMNRNTAAALIGAIAIMWMARLVGEARVPSNGTHPRQALRGTIERPQLNLILPFAALALCVIAVLGTASRAGGLLLAGGLAMVLTMLLRDQRRSRQALIISVGILLVGVVLAIELFGEALYSRLDRLGVGSPSRIEVYWAILDMIRDRPWWGTGFGTFAEAFPAYRQAAAPTRGIWDRAHNTPLQIAVEFGIPLTVLIMGAWSAIGLVLVRRALQPLQGQRHMAAIAAIFTMASLHSLVDYPLQITGYAIPFFFLIGVGLGALGSMRLRSQELTTQGPGATH